ncbi:uncharacterized protein [Henckelia pumila]|uniref:uncharacterized protein isoform X2 n=1 Tax=Henckelia pumila TaxID=405737 RepID=UPI003C6E9F32
MKAVNYERPGGPDLLQIEEGILLYQFDHDSYLGCECSGKVLAVGSHVRKFKEGDEVCAVLELGGGYAEFVVVPAVDALRIPSGVSLVEAAALPEALRLTDFALSAVKNVTSGKTILIHGTAGGIDFIAIQYVKHIGCKVFAAAGTEEKLRICKLLGAEVCINYEKEDFCKRVKAETGETGVDIILDVSGKDHFQKNMDCLAKGGSIVVSGYKISSWVDVDLSSLMKKDTSIKGVDLRTIDILNESDQLWSDVEAKFWPLIEDGHIKPIIGKIFSFTEAAKAHRALEEGCIPGKLLLVPKEDDVV